MKAWILPFLIISAWFFAGCIPAQIVALRPEAELVKSYQLGEEHTQVVGLPILQVIHAPKPVAFTPAMAYEPPTPVVSGMSNEQIPLQPGDIWTASHVIEGGDYILRAPGYGHAIRVQPDGTVIGGWVSPMGRKLRQEPWLASFRFEPADYFIDEGGFKAELVYSGRSGSTVKMLYREYVDDFARQAFYQNVEYDLSESSRIRFKSFVIDITSATNEEITYSVVDDGGLPWLP